jgi:hypothetical protein
VNSDPLEIVNADVGSPVENSSPFRVVEHESVELSPTRCQRVVPNRGHRCPNAACPPVARWSAERTSDCAAKPEDSGPTVPLAIFIAYMMSGAARQPAVSPSIRAHYRTDKTRARPGSHRCSLDFDGGTGWDLNPSLAFAIRL